MTDRALARRKPAVSTAVVRRVWLQPEVLPVAAFTPSGRNRDAMNETTCRKTYKEKLRPTPAQERMLGVLWRCRTLYNTALEQRITAWQRCHVSVSRYRAGSRIEGDPAEFPEYAAIHSTSCKTCWRGWTRRIKRSSGGSSAARRRASRASRAQATATTRSPSRSIGNGARWTMAFSGPLQDWAYQRPLVAPNGGHAQDGHDLQRGRWLVCGYLLCRGAHTAACPPPGRRRA